MNKRDRPKLLASPRLIVPKQGAAPIDCEDVGGVTCSAAFLADGCSGSVYSREFAKILAEKALKQKSIPAGPIEFARWIQPIRDEWVRTVEAIAPRSPIIRHKIAKGSHAAFCLLTIDSVLLHPRPLLSFTVAQIGDVTFAHVRNDQLLLLDPHSENAFGTTPPLISTDDNYNLATFPYLRFRHGFFEPNDRWFIMTDALGEWFASEYSAGNKPWEKLSPLDKHNFKAFVSSQRQNGSLKDDDTGLLHGQISIAEID